MIGQFNKAFIIACSPTYEEVYLIDQHASDEKTNYERLLKSNEFQSQPLVKTIVLPLTPQEVEVLETNRDIFKKNGFVFEIRKRESEGQSTAAHTSEDQKEYCLLIKQLPVSKHIQFNLEDFDEIFSKINTGEDVLVDISTCRPKKI